MDAELMDPELVGLLDITIALTDAASGNVRLLEPDSGELLIVAHRGLPDWWLDYWRVVRLAAGSWGAMLRRGDRVIVEDVEASPFFVGTPGLDIHRRAGVRALQSTPILSKDRGFIGMFSTLYGSVHRPDAEELQLLDLFARHVADTVDRRNLVVSPQPGTPSGAGAPARARETRRMAFEAALSYERERRRLATDLHDGVGQTLALLQIELSGIRAAAEPLLRSSLAKCVALVEEAIDQTRALTFDASPSILYDLGLAPALEWLAERMKSRYGLSVAFRADVAPTLTNTVAVIAFRAVRELLINVAKHAAVTSAALTLGRAGDRIVITVEDSGRGFVSAGRESAGYGLFSVREHVEQLGGSMAVTSTPGAGTRVILEVPASGEVLQAGEAP